MELFLNTFYFLGDVPNDLVGFTFFIGTMAMMAASVFFFLSLNAVDAKESSTALQKLNAIFADEYSMKVYKTKSGSYVARTLDGKDVLVAK